MRFLKSLKVAAVVVATSCVALSASAQDLRGAGSSFVNPLFQKMFSQYTAAKVDYQSIGSGGGIAQLTAKTVDFGDSDAPLNDEQTTKMGGPAAVLHIPMTSGAVVVTYNVPGVSSGLKLSGKDLADIYLGKVTKWNSPEVKDSNPGVNLPDLPIVVIHRSDGSGTSFIFTDYLTKVNTDWSSKVGKASAPNWPAGLGGKGSEGVAGLVKQTPGAIGYVELAYALQNKMPYAYIQNKGGKFINPTLAATTLASNVAIPADTKVSVTNTDNPAGYPIASFTWALIYKEQNYNGRTKDQATKLVKLLWWNIHEGQKFCEALNYAPLSKSAVKAAEAVLKSATYGGKAIL
ncbi:MAG TPA: phosphate ABC transporter substrate-binding protein PstS [Mucilaginibacter sp.]